MKKILYSIFVAAIFWSCDILDLSPSDKYDEDTVWGDANLVKAYENGLYNAVPNGFSTYMWARFCDESYGENTILQETYTADNISGYASGTSGYLDYWDYAYKYIRKCNVFFEKLDETPLTDAEKATLSGEVKFVRAFIYANLLWRYGSTDNGGVPLVKQSYELGDASTFTRSTYEESVTYIVTELDAAIALLPAQYATSNANFGRATQHACMALKSRVLLYAASPLNNPANDASKWQAAADASKAVLDLNAYTLTANYRDLFQAVSNELIFARVFTTASGHNATFINTPRYFGGYGGWGGRNCPTTNLVNDYEMNNGIAPFNEDGTVNAASGYSTSAPHANRDPRFYASILYNGAVFQGHTMDYALRASGFDANGKPVYSGKYGADNIKVSSDNSTTYYNIRKFMDESVAVSNSTKYTQPWPFFRLGEMYLNYAEAIFKVGGSANEAQARWALNKLRARAGMPDVPDTETGDALWRRILNERRVETAFEGRRYYDVRRLKIAPTTETKPIGGREVYLMPDGTFYYKDFTALARPTTWDAKFYCLPIQRTEITKNLGTLKQNAGFE